MQSAKESNSAFCKKILLEFRSVVREAKEKHKRRYQSVFPTELALTFNGCEIFASSGTRQLLIRADDALINWIRKGFQKALDLHFKAEFEAVTASSQQFIACGEEKVFHYSGNALVVRDKIFWVPHKRMWALNVKKGTVTMEQYLKG